MSGRGTWFLCVDQQARDRPAPPGFAIIPFQGGESHTGAFTRPARRFPCFWRALGVKPRAHCFGFRIYLFPQCELLRCPARLCGQITFSCWVNQPKAVNSLSICCSSLAAGRQPQLNVLHSCQRKRTGRERVPADEFHGLPGPVPAGKPELTLSG